MVEVFATVFQYNKNVNVSRYLGIEAEFQIVSIPEERCSFLTKTTLFHKKAIASQLKLLLLVLPGLLPCQDAVPFFLSLASSPYVFVFQVIGREGLKDVKPQAIMATCAVHFR